MRILSFVVFASIFIPCTGQQFSSDFWHDGFLITSKGDSLDGKLNYNMETNIVQVKKNNRRTTFSSFKIFYFELYDQTVNNYRRFYTLPFAIKSDYKTPVIFELLYEGSISLLSRERIVQKSVPSSNPYSTTTFVQNQLEYTFYFVDKKGNISYYNGKKNDLYTILTKNQSKVRKFIKDNKLRTDNIRDLVRITAFYNSI
jgi:hypothetical protein